MAQPRRLVVDREKLWEKIGYTPHPGQREILSSPARFQVAACGRRFGKSNMEGHRLTPEAFRAYPLRNLLKEEGRRHEFWIVGPEYSDAEKEFRVVWNDLTRLGFPFDRPGTYNDPLGGNMHISLFNGTFQIHAKSARHPETLVGEGLHGVVLSEAAKLKQVVWDKFIRPTLADYRGWARMTSTPEGRNWFYDCWRKGQDPSSWEWASWRRPSWHNPHVYPMGASDAGITMIMDAMAQRQPLTPEFLDDSGVDLEIVSLLESLTPEAFNQEIGAQFNEFVGRVFKEWDEERHVTDLEYNPAWETWACCDYGFTNPNVWILLQIGPFGTIHVLDEVYESGLTAPEFAELIVQRGLAPASLRGFYPDPASPGDTRILEKRFRVRARGGTGGERKHRIDAIRLALRDRNPHLEFGHPERVPQILFDRKCVNGIREMGAYRYPQRRGEILANAPEEPMKKDDHFPEALGRFFAGHLNTPQAAASRARVRGSTLTTGRTTRA